MTFFATFIKQPVVCSGWEWDEMAVFRALAVVLVITFLIIFFVVCKMCRLEFNDIFYFFQFINVLNMLSRTWLIVRFVPPSSSFCRNSNRSRVRRYDVLSSKQLEPILNESEDSEDDELFASIPVVSSS